MADGKRSARETAMSQRFRPARRSARRAALREAVVLACAAESHVAVSGYFGAAVRRARAATEMFDRVLQDAPAGKTLDASAEATRLTAVAACKVPMPK